MTTSSADPPPEEQRSSTPSTTFDDIVRASGGRRNLRRLPALIGQAFSLVWASAPRELLLAGGLQVVAGLSLAAQLLVLRRVLNYTVAIEGVPDISAVAPELLLFGVLLAVVAVAAVTQREQQRTLAEYVQRHTTDRVMAVATSVDLIEFERPGFYDRLQRARVNASVRPLQIANGVLGMIGSGVTVAAVGFTLLLVEPLVVALLVVGGLPSLFLNRLSSRVMHTFAVEQTPADRRRAYLYQTLSRKEEAQEVRAFQSSGYLRAEHSRLYDERMIAWRATVRRRLLYGTLAGLTTSAVTVGAILMLLAFVRIGRLSVGDAAVAVGAVVLVAGRLRALVGSSGSLYEGSLFLEDFTEFVKLAPREHDRPTAPRTSAALPRAAASISSLAPFERLQMRAVDFTYPSRREPSLRGISLTIERGEIIALVGENGSGKTTLTKLLAGLYRPTSGTLLWDDQDIANVDLAALREHIAVIFQDFARYFLTARENIAISRTSAIGDEQRVRAAAKSAGADDFLAGLPSGYASLLGPAFYGGSGLSTGQWQRVALARAYFRDAPLLILDEPTASLDPRGEYEIFKQVRRLAEGHTVVLVSHRFSSVRAADRILVLEAGHIVEQGSHASLVNEAGLYAELFHLQAEGYRGQQP
jgi:ATP-binding cassette, subfamily B, bacterial